MVKVYFAHSWASESSVAPVVMHYLMKAFPNWKFVNPFDSPLTQEWQKNPDSLDVAIKIIDKDLSLIHQCDFVIAYLPDLVTDDKSRAMIGTPMEIFYASFVLNKPVYTLTSFKHPWLNRFTDYKTDNIFALIKELKGAYEC